MARVLVVCEFSGIVRDAFRACGHNAYSCDLLPTESPRVSRSGDPLHFQEDAFKTIKRRDWDLMIAHPPCTFLANSGVLHLYKGRKKENGIDPTRWADMLRAVDFFNALLAAPVKHIAVENPVQHCHAAERIHKPYTQSIQPWMFGHGETKATCLWLKNLPPLLPTHQDNSLFVPPAPSEREPRVHYESPGPNRWKNRSRTLPGIAQAMATQWGAVIAKEQAA